jgi:hypothetical protein
MKESSKGLPNLYLLSITLRRCWVVFEGVLIDDTMTVSQSTANAKLKGIAASRINEPMP